MRPVDFAPKWKRSSNAKHALAYLCVEAPLLGRRYSNPGRQLHTRSGRSFMLGAIFCPDASARNQNGIDHRPPRARVISCADSVSWCATGTDLFPSLPARTLDCRHICSRIDDSGFDHRDCRARALAARHEPDLKCAPKPTSAGRSKFYEFTPWFGVIPSPRGHLVGSG
jgi:hypothetical protein